MALSIALPRLRAIPQGRVHLRLRPPSEAWAAFGLALVLYLAVAAILVFKGNAVAGDAISRVGTANGVLFSRDPHLAAIGFVWSPLPNLVLVPLVPLKFLWPALVQQAFLGNIVSALFMAAAVYQMDRFLQDLGVRRALRLLLIAGFALHPMIILHGANAMSEAPLIFFLLLVVRHLTRWLRTREMASLTATGMYLALAYLTRYEASAAAIAVVAIVAVASYTRARGVRRTRVGLALCDSLIAGAPYLVTFVVFAVASWLITGIAFQQFSSVYGTAAQLNAKGLSNPSVHQELVWAVQGVKWMLALEPLLPVVAVAVAIRSLVRRDLQSLAAPAVLAAVVAFMFWAHTTGTILQALRYFIVVIPLVTVMVGILLAPQPGRVAPRTTARAPATWHKQALRFGGIGVLSTLAYILLYNLVREWLSAGAANGVTLLITAVANTAANRRLSFGACGRRWMLRDQVAGLLAFGVALALTTGALATLRVVDPAPSRSLEVAVLVGGSLLATAVRFVLLRVAVLHHSETTRVHVRGLGTSAVVRGGFALACVLLVAIALPVGVRTVLDPDINHAEAYPLQALLQGGPRTTPQRQVSSRYLTDRQVAAYIDAMHLPRGAVLIDSFRGFVVVMASAHPEEFVTTADRDFRPVLADPGQAGVEYLLVPPDNDLGLLDAVNRQYPGIYSNGAGIATLVRQFDDPSDLAINWRLYRVNPQQ
ncbi:MAG TPA: hypothetical protein VN193_02555 [Candidatus Angelobacter sp.]|jgi:hypothetical protein|nr:hypothetical protein [Candidatus Angelobacter sp.]